MKSYFRSIGVARLKRITLYLIVVMVAVATSTSLANSTAKPRVAVWVRSKELENIAALAQAALSESGEAQLVERQALQKVIDEQSLAKLGLIDADHAIAVGALVSCELFAAVEGDSSDASLIVFDAHSGVRLCDVPIRIGSGDEAAANDLTAQLRGAVTKYGHLPAGHVLCLHTVRNADLPHTFDPLCRAAAKMLERRLCASPAVSILERSRLDRLTEEHQLTGANASLTVSPILLDLQMARSAGAGIGQPGPIDVTVVINNVGGSPVATVAASVRDTNAQAIAEAILPKVMESLKLAVPPAPTDADRALEASQFSRETLIHWEHSEIAEALESAEAAHALNPADHHLQAMRARALAAQAAALVCRQGDFANPSHRTDPYLIASGPHQGKFVLSFEYATVALGAASVAQVRVGKNWPLSSDPIHFLSPALDDDFMIRNTLQILRGYLAQIRREQSDDKQTGADGNPLVFDPDEQNAYEQTLLAFRRYRLETEEPIARELTTDARTYQAYCIYLTDLMYDLRCVCAVNGKQWTADWKSVVDAWVPIAEKYGAPDPADGQRPLNEAADIRLLLPLYDVPAGKTLYWGGPERQANDWDSLHYSMSWRMTVGDWQRYRSIYEAVGAGISDPRVRDLVRVAEHNLDETIAAIGAPPALPPVILASIAPQPLRGDETAPQPTVGPGTKWPDSRLLLDATDPAGEVSSIGSPCVAEQGESAYAIAMLRRSGGNFSPALMKFDLATGRRETVAVLEASNAPGGAAGASETISISQAQFRGSRGSICGDWFVLCDSQAGIFLFPLSGGAVQRIDARVAHLPNDDYQAATLLDGTLYLSVGHPDHDGYLLAYDLKRGDLKTLAASRRVAAGAEPTSPFDNSAPLFSWFMQADPARHRIVFLIGNRAWEKGKSGWWSYEPATSQFKQLFACEVVADPQGAQETTWATAHGDQITFASPGQPLATLNLSSDKVAPLPPIPDCQNVGLDSRQYPAGQAVGSPITEVDGWCWGKFGRYRQSTTHPDKTLPRDAALVQCFEPPTRSSYRCGEWPEFLTVIDGDHVLAGNLQSLWSIHIPTDDPVALARVMRTPQPLLATVERIGPAPSGGQLPWSTVRTIYDVAGYEDGVLNMRCPVIRGDFAYVLACGIHPGMFKSAQLRRYGLVDGSRADYGETVIAALKESAPARIAEQVHTRANVEAAMDDDHYYVADTDRRSVSIFTLDGRRPSNASLTLPANTGGVWKGFAPMEGNKVVVAIETFPVGARNEPWNRPAPTAKLCQIDLASAKTTEFALPAPTRSLDDKQHIHIGPLARDSARHRVIFLLSRQNPEPDFDGIYALDANGVERIIPIDVIHDLKFGNEPPANQRIAFGWCGAIRDQRWIFGFGRDAYEANLTTKQVRSLCPTIAPGRIWNLSEPMTVLGSWLYHAGFGRLSADGSRFEQFPPLRPIDEHGYQFHATLLEPSADSKSLIVADGCGMWILRLNEGAKSFVPP